MAVPGGPLTLPLRYAGVGALAGVQAGFAALARAQPSLRTRVADLLRRVLPGSGFGPSGDLLREWSWQLAVDARTDGGHFVRVDLDADGHPGYLTTSRMLGESGILLSEDGSTPDRSGCLTPATALGTASLERFEAAGMRFRVSS
jgi:short subunit dehydrogenase-like uncharacterized protein